MNRRIDIEEVPDLRSIVPQTFALSQALPERATSLFGPKIAFGTPPFAAIDAKSISPRLAPPPDPIPGWRIADSIWPGERFIVRVPKRWNGRLVVAGTPASRTEFANDVIWSDPLVARGYAYACGNKGQGEGAVILAGDDRLVVDGVKMPRFFAAPTIGVSFWQHAPGATLKRWMDEFFALTTTAGELVERLHRRAPEFTYAVGLSNGGNQVRHALERSDLFAGGLSWNAVLWSVEHNLLRQLPPAVEAMHAGHPERLPELGFPPDVRGTSGASLYERNLHVYWAVTAWLYGMVYDPEASIPYRDVREPRYAESWSSRIASWRPERSPLIAERIGAYAHTGALRAPLIDLASEYDHLIAPAMHFHPYGQLVAAAGKSDLYRGEMIPNAQHVDAWSDEPDFPTMRPGYPRVLAAFDELVRWVEG